LFFITGSAADESIVKMVQSTIAKLKNGSIMPYDDIIILPANNQN